MFYYPKEAADRIVQEIHRPAYSAYRVDAFFSRLKESTAGSLDVENELKRTDRVTLSGIADDLTRQVTFWPQIRQFQEALSEALATRSSEFLQRPVSLAAQSELIERLQPFPSIVVDEAVFALLTSTWEKGREHDEDTLVLSCAKRLIRHPQFGVETQAICQKIFGEGSHYRDDYLRLRDL